jgi:beta-phosphoglucomutase
MRFTGGIFDVDGVLLDTPHARAWRDALAQLMDGPWRALEPTTSYRPGAFTEAVYQEYVADKPRRRSTTFMYAIRTDHLPGSIVR